MFLFSNFVSQHPNIVLFLYILFCIFFGIGIFFGSNAIRRKIQIRKNMKARVRNDKSN